MSWLFTLPQGFSLIATAEAYSFGNRQRPFLNGIDDLQPIHVLTVIGMRAIGRRHRVSLVASLRTAGQSDCRYLRTFDHSKDRGTREMPKRTREDQRLSNFRARTFDHLPNKQHLYSIRIRYRVNGLSPSFR